MDANETSFNRSLDSFTYAHLADLHLGSWRDSKLRDQSTAAFDKAIKECIENKVDFVLFAGDIFNTALPSIDIVNHIATKLTELKNANIPLYVIPGSHDFSPTNRSMLDVFESCNLLTNVCKGRVNPDTKQLELKYTIDKKTGAKITGILGRRGMLDRNYYENLSRDILENESGYKIFMFHTTLTELKPKHLEILDSHPASFLPKKQNYYAGGHVHHKTLLFLDGYGPLTYTGALFPNNFAELEKYSYGGYYIVKVTKEQESLNPISLNQDNKFQEQKQLSENTFIQNNFKSQITWQPLKIKEHVSFRIDVTAKSKEQILDQIDTIIDSNTVKDAIVSLRIKGKLDGIHLRDLQLTKIAEDISKHEPFALLINANKVQMAEFEGITLAKEDSSINIEELMISSHLKTNNQFEQNKEKKLIKDLMNSLNTSKSEGEKSYDFVDRIIKNSKILFQDTSETNKSSNQE